MSGFFSSAWFLETAASVLRPDRQDRPGTVAVGSRQYDVLLDRRGRVVSLPLVDFYEARTQRASLVRVISAPGLSAVSLGLRPVAGQPGPTSPDQRVAPCIRWSTFSSWEDFVARVSARQWRAFRQSDRKLRKIAREVGSVRWSLDAQDHTLLETMLRWKSQQLRRTGCLDRFVSPRLRQFLHQLLEERHLQLAVLRAGHRPLAIELGRHDTSGLSCWITAYDADFALYSPGTLLFEHLMKASWDAGHTELDFLSGDEAYKYFYATHERLIGPVGRPSPQERLRTVARRLFARGMASPHAEVVAKTRQRLFQLAQQHLARQETTGDQRPPWLQRIEQTTETWPASPPLPSPAVNPPDGVP